MHIEHELKEIRAALSRIEGLLSASSKHAGPPKKKISTPSQEEDFTGASGGVRLLISKGYFSSAAALPKLWKRLKPTDIYTASRGFTTR